MKIGTLKKTTLGIFKTWGNKYKQGFQQDLNKLPVPGSGLWDISEGNFHKDICGTQKQVQGRKEFVFYIL